MTATVPVAVPRKGRPLEAVLERLASRADSAAAAGTAHHRDGPPIADLADAIVSTLRYEKAITKDRQVDDRPVYDRLADYSSLTSPYEPEYTLFRDDREGHPRRVVFDSVTIPVGDIEVRLVGREEPFRAVRTHSFAFGFDSADLMLEEVVELGPEPLRDIQEVNARINPHDTDVRVVSGLGDTVYHTLLATPETRRSGPGESLDRGFVSGYRGRMCISPRYERLVEAVLGTRAVEGIQFCYPEEGREEEASIADAGLGVYLTMTGSTAREHGLDLGERLFPSETVLMENTAETDGHADTVRDLFAPPEDETELAV